MRYTLVAVGRSSKGPEQDLFKHYAARLRPPLKLKEVEEKRPMSVADRQAREAVKLLDAVPSGAKIVALDERGKTFDSVSFAKTLGKWRDQGAPEVAFLIGGADGHDESVRQRADLILNLGTMTWPHMLVRGLIAEQIYRAQCILSGHPYHRA